MKQLITLSALSLLVLASAAASAQSMGQTQAPSAASAYPVTPAPGLFEAFGGQTGIRGLMNDFVNRLKADPRTAEAFKDANASNLASQLSDQIYQLAHGPCVYKGPDMKEAHSNMDVTRADFNALVEVLQITMEARGIPFARQNQLLALLAPMHRDVVNVR